jgi:hypothetical protein
MKATKLVDEINAILTFICLTLSLEDPCYYKGFIWDLNDKLDTKLVYPLILDLYVDDFVYFSEDPTIEALFLWLLSECCQS